jgi:2-methylisocitrate lyase-like PEP mutase family enzyme
LPFADRTDETLSIRTIVTTKENAMTSTRAAESAAALRSLAAAGVLVLPNAWDAGSARLIERAGARAIATTSGGVSWSLGKPDGEGASREEQVDAVARIVGAVRLPVSADIEGGYGPRPEDVAETVRAVVAAGAGGVNLEDSRRDGTLHPAEEQALRIAAARAAAADAGAPDLVINLRTDVFLFAIGAPEGRLGDALTRARAYAAAGADGLFVPGVVDEPTIRSLLAESPLPINVMAGPGSPTVAELTAMGVRRISVGTAVAEAAYLLAERAATEILTSGSYTALEPGGTFSAVNSAFGSDR